MAVRKTTKREKEADQRELTHLCKTLLDAGVSRDEVVLALEQVNDRIVFLVRHPKNPPVKGIERRMIKALGSRSILIRPQLVKLLRDMFQ